MITGIINTALLCYQTLATVNSIEELVMKSVFSSCFTKQIKVGQGSSVAALCLFAAQKFAGPTGETLGDKRHKNTRRYTWGLMMVMYSRGVLKSLLSTTRCQESTAVTQQQRFEGIYHQFPPTQHLLWQRHSPNPLMDSDRSPNVDDVLNTSQSWLSPADLWLITA